MIFYVKKRADERVVIEATPPTIKEVLLNEISAKTWKEARAKCVVGGFELYSHREGYGYYDT